MSTFAELISRPNVKKNVLVEIDIGEEQSFWTNLRPFVYYVDWDNVYDRIDSSLLPDRTAKDIADIGSVTAGSDRLTRTSMLANCVSNNKTFFYERQDNRLTIHLTDGNPPNIYRITVGIVYGVANFPQDHRDHHYEGRLKGIPKIKQSRDRLFFGKVVFQGGTIQIDNMDGEYDTWADDNDVFGNEVRIRIGFDELTYDDYELVYTSFVETVKIDEATLTIGTMDLRKQLVQKIPTGVFSQAIYPNMRDQFIGQPIPWIFGTVRGVPAIPINDAVVKGAYTFVIADPGYGREMNAITTVYADGVAITPTATDLEACTVTVDDADYDPHGTAGSVIITCDVSGFETPAGANYTDPVEITKELLEHVADFQYNADYFDTAEWGSVTAIGDVGLHIGKQVKLIVAIERLMHSTLAWITVKAAGILGLRKYDLSRAIDYTIHRDDMLKTPRGVYDPREIYTSVRVGYNERPALGTLEYYIHDADEAARSYVLKTKVEKTADTLLSGDVDTEDWATAFLEIAGDVSKIVTIETYIGMYAVEVGDFIEAQCTRQDNTRLFGWVKVEVLSVEYDLTKFTVKIIGRIIATI